ncbi:MAG: MFS transporter [Candidatus Microbacterium phytovorans]|uniref:MFS transporter n=1 Tax=Candidatus Microbacterium phytovorans TaxID=3121374 RepID=A0AAJ5W0U7_9MICO|nr:MFS transporter [Microbacterium sp.]WEK13148.1 MAG: MFS transporter [Microbacterium sp.]
MTPQHRTIFALPLTFFGFLMAVAVSDLGDSFRLLALDLWFYESSTDKEGARLTLLLASVIPALLVAPLAGAVADRFDLRRTFIATTALRGIISLGLAAVAHSLGVGETAIVLVVASAVASVFFTSSAFVFVPRLVKQNLLPRANGILESMTWALAAVGPAAGALAFAAWGPAPSFLIDGASFLLSALLFKYVLVKPVKEVTDQRRARGGVRQLAREFGELLQGVGPAAAYLASHRYALGLLLASYGVTITAAANSFSLIFLIAVDLQLPAEAFGLVLSWNGVVAVVAALIVGFIVRASGMQTLYLACLGLFAVAQIIIGLAPNLFILIIGVALSALINAPYNVAVTTLFQTSIADEYLGRVEGLDVSVDNALRIGTLIAAAAAVATWGPRSVLVVSGIVALVLLIVGGALMLRSTGRSGTTRKSADRSLTDDLANPSDS